jgi:hypothetical protein
MVALSSSAKSWEPSLALDVSYRSAACSARL